MIILGFFRPRILALSSYNANQFHTSAVSNDKIWRMRNGLPKHKNQFGPLTDLPDYSYLDGRLTPLGVHQLDRAKKQEELATKMVTMLSEVNFAVERHNKMIQDKELERERIITGRLKEKGDKLYKKY